MKNIFQLIALAVLISCNTPGKTEESVQVEVEPVSKETQEVKVEKLSNENGAPQIVERDEINPYSLDSVQMDKIAKISDQYASVPFFTVLDGREYFVIGDKEVKNRYKIFQEEIKFGLVNDSLVLLKPLYDKIYNPDMVMLNCFEIKEGNKVGLYNYQSNQILEPQFDFIFPIPSSDNRTSTEAMGFRNNRWFKISNHDLFTIDSADFEPEMITNLSYGTKTDITYFYVLDNGYVGPGALINPSYVEHLDLLPEAFMNVIVEGEALEHGVEDFDLFLSTPKKLSDRLTAFFVSVYEMGIDARDYSMRQDKIMVYNAKSEALKSYDIVSNDGYYGLCNFNNRYTFLNDSIIELKESYSNKIIKENLNYDFFTNYSYKQLLSNGEIITLTSDRIFDFTKFTVINENYFIGCYAHYIDQEDYSPGQGNAGEGNVFTFDHLSIEDLDIMRNEIFAEYGYKFKSEKWSSYFATKPWYRPLHDNVNDKLSDIDRENIQVILRVRKTMEGKEEEYINKRLTAYYAAG